MKLKKALRAALTVATLAAGGVALSAAPAHASSFSCVLLPEGTGTACSHQTTIPFNGSEFDSSSTREWWGPYDVLKLQTDGNLVLYCHNYGSSTTGKAVWASGTNFNPLGSNVLADVDFQTNGDMSIWWMDDNGYFSLRWVSKTGGHSGDRAVVQADGNFVIWSSSGQALWASNTYHACGNGDQNYWVGYQ